MQYNILQYRPNPNHFLSPQVAQSLQLHWFKGVVLGLCVYILFFKDISIQLQLNSKTTSEAMGFFQEQSPQELPVAPAAEKSASNVSLLEKGKKHQWDSRTANDFSNLTFVLSPDYAKRHKVHPSIVKTKVNICKQYIKDYAPLAQKEKERFGIPVSITLAQGLLESNAGESRLAQESNNHFGIKCRTKCKGCTCRNYSDDDVYDMFRVFDSVWESYREHSLLLVSSRYKHLLDLPPDDYEAWARGLKKAGYATDKRYAEKLIQIIEFLNLDRYDS
ncbi:MAG TPA: glucosaminidase domain-containing protein [Saprospiraceae bacterium]|nr:glucosaminidase domain-containing protein [Saprospiraceae bacterium]HMQ83867.1 glucosaminidase domain-containing protein [Saprospiraceae bacterium]